MKDKLNNIVGNTKEAISLSTPGRKVAVGSIAALAVFAYFPSETKAVKSSNVYQGTEGTISQSLSLNSKTGRANCQISAESYTLSFNSLSIIMSIQNYRKGQWRNDNNFEYSDAISHADKENSMKIKGSNTTNYSLKQLKRSTAKYPTRLACVSGFTENYLSLPNRIFK